MVLVAAGEHHDIGAAAGVDVDLAGDFGQADALGELAHAEVDQDVADGLRLPDVLEAQQEAIPKPTWYTRTRTVAKTGGWATGPLMSPRLLAVGVRLVQYRDRHITKGRCE
jgi:hypothetical protein